MHSATPKLEKSSWSSKSERTSASRFATTGADSMSRRSHQGEASKIFGNAPTTSAGSSSCIQLQARELVCDCGALWKTTKARRRLFAP